MGGSYKKGGSVMRKTVYNIAVDDTTFDHVVNCIKYSIDNDKRIVILITEREHAVVPDGLEKIEGGFFIKNIADGLRILDRFLDHRINNGNYFFLDTETTGLDSFKSEIVLFNIGDKNIQLLFDMTSFYQYTVKYTNSQILKKGSEMLFERISKKVEENQITVVGHNLKYDWKILNNKRNSFDFKNIFDTMIAEQRLFKGYVNGYALDDLCMRYYGGMPLSMKEEVALTFKANQPLRTYQIQYAADDLYYLEGIYKNQLNFINQYDMGFLLYGIEFPLVRVLGKIENTGLVLNVDKVRQLYKENEQKRFEVECELDKTVRELRDLMLDEQQATYLKGGKYDRERKRTVVTIGSLFDEGETRDISNDKAYINYSAPLQILSILGRLKVPVPDKFTGEPVMISFDKKNKPYSKYSENLTTDEKVWNEFLIEHPGHPAKEFMELLFKYREYDGEINKYGEDFIKNINPITGMIHTIYKQAFTENGRLASGGGKKEPDKFQSQNLPAKPAFRSLFGFLKGYSLTTIDLAGAEVTIMADKANDTKLFDLAMKGDIHSHIATLGWRNIYKNRGDDYNAETFVVSKTVNKDKRKTGKNLTFGGIYGCGARRAGKTIGVSSSEGKIYIETLKSEFPKTFKMVENNVNFALSNGYIINNKRTNSRLWFKIVETVRKEQREMTWEEIDSVNGQARNIPISGTQADMLKEAMVTLNYFFEKNNLDCHILLQVHDELVIAQPKNMDGVSDEYKANPVHVIYDDQEMTIPQLIKTIVTKTANYYLTNIKMEAEYVVGEHWIKD